MRAFLFILILLFAVSCGDDEETTDLDDFPDRRERRERPDGHRLGDDPDGTSRGTVGEKERVKKDCDKKMIQNSGSECLFLLSSVKHGETYTTQYKEISNSRQHDGVKAALGRGKWICEDGKWREIAKPICLICPAGDLFEKCLTRLEEEEELWRRWQEAQRLWKGTEPKINLPL